MLLIQTWFDWLPPYPNIGLGTREGYSLISFIMLYLLARAIKLYGLPEWFKRISPVVYLLCSILLIVGNDIVKSYGMTSNWWFAYNNPIVIISSVAFLISFERIKIQSRFINHIAKSTLACLLGHTMLTFLYRKPFIYMFENMSGLIMVLYWLSAVVLIFLVLVVIDQFRLIMFKPLGLFIKKTRQNCLFES